MMIRLAAACRNTSVRRTTGTTPEPMMSANTCPGPTEGSWSISPTISSAALSGVAFMSACINMTSTMEASSITSRSQSTGLSALRLKPPPMGSTSRSRWIVLASTPVASVMRLAARPVGAHSNSLTFLAPRILRIELTIVVLPTPGPPVITSAFAVSASRIAALWLSASCRPLRFSTQGRAFSSSIHDQGSLPFTMRISRSAKRRRILQTDAALATADLPRDRRFRRTRTSQRPAGAHRGESLVKRREDPRFSNFLANAVPVEVRAQIGAHARERDANVLGCEFAEQVADSPGGRIVEVGHSAGVEDEPPDRRGRLVDERAHLVGESIGVGVEQIRAEPVDDKSGF